VACRHYVSFERLNLTPCSDASRFDSDALGRIVRGAGSGDRLLFADRLFGGIVSFVAAAATAAVSLFFYRSLVSKVRSSYGLLR
jgi:hypothetical protein